MRFIPKETVLIRLADAFAEQAHRGQVRLYTGEPYIEHPRRVAQMVKAAGLPEIAVVAALLHDVLEDTSATTQQLTSKFGHEVAKLVGELTNPILPKSTHDDRFKENLVKVAAASPTAKSIKCADIIDNVASIASYDPKFAARYVPEKRRVAQVLTNADPVLQRMLRTALDQAERKIACTQLRS